MCTRSGGAMCQPPPAACAVPFTRTPLEAHSSERVLVRLSTAARAAPVWPMPTKPFLPRSISRAEWHNFTRHIASTSKDDINWTVHCGSMQCYGCGVLPNSGDDVDNGAPIFFHPTIVCFTTTKKSTIQVGVNYCSPAIV